MLSTEQIQIEISRQQLDSWYPLIALPCYDRQLTEPFFMSMIKTSMKFRDYGLKFAVSTISDSLISRGRNQLVAKFMGNPDFTHLMFIDVDLGFEGEDILKLLWHDKDIITGAYPIKEINWEKVKNNALSGMETDNLLESSLRYVVNPVKAGENKALVENGAIRIYDAGTGFMLIKREVFERMFEKYPELKYIDDTGSLRGEERENSYALFNSYVDPETGRFLSEDYGFGRYWQLMGGDVWVDPSIKLTHLGRMEYTGTLINWLTQNATHDPRKLNQETHVVPINEASKKIKPAKPAVSSKRKK